MIAMVMAEKIEGYRQDGYNDDINYIKQQL